MEYKAGDIVISVAGHDAGRHYVVVNKTTSRVLLCDGRDSKISHSKAKNPKHIRFVYHNEQIEKYIANNQLYDCHIRNALSNVSHLGG